MLFKLSTSILVLAPLVAIIGVTALPVSITNSNDNSYKIFPRATPPRATPFRSSSLAGALEWKASPKSSSASTPQSARGDNRATPLPSIQWSSGHVGSTANGMSHPPPLHPAAGPSQAQQPRAPSQASMPQLPSGLASTAHPTGSTAGAANFIHWEPSVLTEQAPRPPSRAPEKALASMTIAEKAQYYRDHQSLIKPTFDPASQKQKYRCPLDGCTGTGALRKDGTPRIICDGTRTYDDRNTVVEHLDRVIVAFSKSLAQGSG